MSIESKCNNNLHFHINKKVFFTQFHNFIVRFHIIQYSGMIVLINWQICEFLCIWFWNRQKTESSQKGGKEVGQVQISIYYLCDMETGNYIGYKEQEQWDPLYKFIAVV